MAAPSPEQAQAMYDEIRQKVAEVAAVVGYTSDFVEAMTRLLAEQQEQTAINAIKTAPMLARLRPGSQWNLDMAVRGADTEEVEGACVMRFPRKPGDRCEVTFVAGEVGLTTRH